MFKNNSLILINKSTKTIIHQAPVVHRAATSVQWINCYQVDKNVLQPIHFIYWIATYLVPVVQSPDNFIRWIRHYSASKIYFTLNVVQGFRTLPNLAVVRVCIFTCTRGNTEIFAQIETVR